MMPRSALITGISGQDGWFLAKLLLKKGTKFMESVEIGQNLRVLNQQSFFQEMSLNG